MNTRIVDWCNRSTSDNSFIHWCCCPRCYCCYFFCCPCCCCCPCFYLFVYLLSSQGQGKVISYTRFLAVCTHVFDREYAVCTHDSFERVYIFLHEWFTHVFSHTRLHISYTWLQTYLHTETVLLPSITTIHRLGGMSGNQSEASSFGRLHPAIAILVGYV